MAFLKKFKRKLKKKYKNYEAKAPERRQQKLERLEERRKVAEKKLEIQKLHNERAQSNIAVQRGRLGISMQREAVFRAQPNPFGKSVFDNRPLKQQTPKKRRRKKKRRS